MIHFDFSVYVFFDFYTDYGILVSTSTYSTKMLENFIIGMLCADKFSINNKMNKYGSNFIKNRFEKKLKISSSTLHTVRQ